MQSWAYQLRDPNIAVCFVSSWSRNCVDVRKTCGKLFKKYVKDKNLAYEFRKKCID